MSREITPFALRMPAELRSSLEDAAKLSKKSLNSELVDRLVATLAIDEAMQIGHRGADYSHAAGALQQLEEDLRDKQEEVDGLVVTGYADEMHALIRRTDAELQALLRRNEEQASDTQKLVAAMLLVALSNAEVDARLSADLSFLAKRYGGEREAAINTEGKTFTELLQPLVYSLMTKAMAEDLGI